MRLKLLAFFSKNREGMKTIKLYKRGLNHLLIHLRDLFLTYYSVLALLFCLFLGTAYIIDWAMASLSKALDIAFLSVSALLTFHRAEILCPLVAFGF